MHCTSRFNVVFIYRDHGSRPHTLLGVFVGACEAQGDIFVARGLG